MSRQDGSSRLEIQLKPEFLGKLSVVLTASESGVGVQIRAASEETRGLLLAHVDQLRSSLESAGVDMKNIEIANGQTGWDFTNLGGGQRRDAQAERREDREQALRRLRSGAVPFPGAVARAASYGAAELHNAYLRDEDVSVEFLA